ncbi:MAG: Eco57I restriction-modification methylase domain-containing protein [Immundisolibacteraceae bacterium]|nr:Eco57I restriction-modification methylase domain-containing protein [Immundisolibacteraceae bacterium]
MPALPNLHNICFGNSLIDSSITSNGDQHEINPFDFGNIKFDIIVGNPPYMATEHMKQFTPLELPLYKKHYSSSFKQFDKYFLFIERGLMLLKPKGLFGYIVPSKFIKVGAGKKLRELLVLNKSVEQIISFGANQVFHDKTTYTCLLILKNDKKEALKYLEVDSLKNWKTRKLNDEHFDSIKYNELERCDWVLVPAALKPVFNAIKRQSETLEDLIGSDNIYNGIQTSANNIYIHSKVKEDKEYIYFSKDGIDWKVEKILTRSYYRTSSGDDKLNTYRPFSPNTFVIYPYLKTKEGISFVEINSLKSEYPNLFAFLNHYKSKLDNSKRDIKPAPETANEWYRFGRHQSLDKCDVPAKIIVGVLSQGNKYAIDYFGTLISSGGTAGYCMITLPENFPYSIYYIQALLNSKYLEWFSALIGEAFRGGYIARGTKVLKKLPIRKINFENKEEKEIHDKISSIQQELINIQGLIDKNKGNNRKNIPLQRQFEKGKNELNQLLKILFNLGESDNKIPLIGALYEAN